MKSHGEDDHQEYKKVIHKLQIVFIIQTHGKVCRKPPLRGSSVNGEEGQQSPMFKTIGWLLFIITIGRQGSWLLVIGITTTVC